MSHGGVCAHINTELCVQGGEGEENGVMGGGCGLASNLQGLASNTIWRETIQFAGIREGKEGQMRNRSKKINRSEVTDKSNLICFQYKQRKRAGSENLQIPLGRNILYKN